MNMDDVLDDSDKIITGGFATVGRYAVIGHPISQSRSPELHENWFRGKGLPGTYEAVDIDAAELIARAPSLPYEFAGINVTAPHKVSILGFVDRIDRHAEAAGAANLIYRDKDKAWTAGNTDGLGMLRALEEATGETTLGKDIVILGAGGAASARRGQAGGATPRDADEPLLAASLGDADASGWALGILAERGLASQARPTVLGGLTRGSIAAA